MVVVEIVIGLVIVCQISELRGIRIQHIVVIFSIVNRIRIRMTIDRALLLVMDKITLIRIVMVMMEILILVVDIMSLVQEILIRMVIITVLIKQI